MVGARRFGSTKYLEVLIYAHRSEFRGRTCLPHVPLGNVWEVSDGVVRAPASSRRYLSIRIKSTERFSSCPIGARSSSMNWDNDTPIHVPRVCLGDIQMEVP